MLIFSVAAKEHSVPIVYDSVINLDASILNKVPKPDQLYMAVYDSPLKLPAAEKSNFEKLKVLLDCF